MKRVKFAGTKPVVDAANEVGDKAIIPLNVLTKMKRLKFDLPDQANWEN